MFGFLKKGLEKTAAAVKKVVPKRAEIVERDLLEEAFLEADISYEIVEEILHDLPEHVNRSRLKATLMDIFPEIPLEDSSRELNVDLIIGVNGAGKTTTIAKLTNMYTQKGESVLLGAGDTFRAAAIEQLKRWADRLGVPIIATKQGHDAPAVAYDTIASAKAKGIKRVIIDTAGRLQTQTNLSNELKKIIRICDKAEAGAPHRKILILDGTQGNTAISQAAAFDEMVGIDGIIITKLDGTAKGGAVFSIIKELELPLIYIGVGEQPDDLIPFEKEAFVDTFLDAIYT
jgi:fused signal recognition particle receptor